MMHAASTRHAELLGRDGAAGCQFLQVDAIGEMRKPPQLQPGEGSPAATAPGAACRQIEGHGGGGTVRSMGWGRVHHGIEQEESVAAAR